MTGHTLPGRRLTSFIGRDRDLNRLLTTLEDLRLVTLLGSGGVGKTRLAEEALHALATAGRDIAWAELAPIDAAGKVGIAIARAVGIDRAPAGDVLDHVISQLGDRALVLGVDNAEHLIDDVAHGVHRLLAGCPNLTVLVTSREVLGVDGERTVRVGTLSPGDAAALFIQRQGLVALAPADADDPAVARICARLDGIPLAIELAASRARALTPTQIADALDDRFTLLTGGSRTAMPRQQTLEASVAWSVELLDDDQRRLLAILSVFAGGFTLDAAVAVAGNNLPEHVVRAGVLDLVDRSLVHPAATQLDQPRFRLLETMRAYAGRILADDAQAADTARRMHAARHREQALAAHAGIRGPDWRRWFALLDEEIADLLAAVDRTEQEDPETAALLMGSLAEYWVRRPQVHGIAKRLRALLDQHGATSVRLAYGAEGLALMLAWYGLTVDIPVLLDTLVRQAVDVRGAEVQAATMGGEWSWTAGSDALPRLDELLARADASGDDWAIAITRFNCATAQHHFGSLARAVELIRAAVADIRRIDATITHSNVFSWGGRMLLTAGAMDEAASLLAEGMASAHESGDGIMLGMAIGWIAELQALRGQVGDWAETAEQIHDAYSRLVSNDRAALLAWANSWWVASRIGVDTPEVQDEARSRELGRVATHDSMCTALTQLYAGDPAAALATLAGADAPERYIRQIERSRLALILAWARRAAGHPDAAEPAHTSLQLHAEHNWVEWPDALDVVAAVDADAGRHDRSIRLFGASDRRRQEMGTVRFPTDQPWVEEVVAGLREALGDDAYDAAYEAGLQLDVDAAMALARTGRDERPVTGWDSLTPAEQETARLAAAGLSNPAIAERLFISRNTVKTHLSAAYRKLGVANRTELSAAVGTTVNRER